jgi:integrase/recombinase XerD
MGLAISKEGIYMNLFTEQMTLSNEPIQQSPIKLPVFDENGDKKHLMEVFDFESMLEDYLIELEIRNYSENTIKTYSSIIHSLINYMRNEEKLYDGKRFLASFRKYIRDLKRDKYLTQNYIYLTTVVSKKFLEFNNIYFLEDIKNPKRTKSLPKSLNEKEVHDLLEAVTINEDDTPFKRKSKRRDKVILTLLYSTGLRISEFCGLTLSDIDLEKEEININHQLQRMRDGTYVVEETKTTAGTRVIPMDVGVADAFRRVLEERKQPKAEPMIDGYTGFLFLDKNEMPRIALHWEHYFKHICDKYNKIYRLQMPKVTPHVCRHTYCSRKARQGMNPKTLQYIMGHSDICVTYNTYTHLGLADAREEMEKIARETADERNEAWLSRRKRAVGS